MKHLKKKILVGIAIIIVLCVFIVLLLEKPGTIALSRGRFENVPDLKPGQVKFNGFAIETHQDDLTVTLRSKYNRCFTIKGILLHNEDRRGKRRVKVISNLKGKYIADFFCFFPTRLEKQSSVFLGVYPPGAGELQPLMSNKLEASTFLERYQIPIEIGQDDSLFFSLEGKGVVIVSAPVFYRLDDYAEKELVFIISADTLRRDHVDVYNPNKTSTPEIDRFAADAVVFKNAYSSSSWTLPAHISLFTGRYAYQHNLNFEKKKNKQNMEQTLFKPLQKRYITMSINGGLFLSHLFGFSQGFDFYYETKHDTTNTFSARFLFRQAKKYISDDNYKVPLLFFLHTYQVHSLFYPESQLAKEYFNNKPYKYDKFEIQELTAQGKNQYKTRVSPEEREEIIKVYDAGIYTFDYWFGGFINYLKKKKLYRSSLIILLSDHGEAFMDHGGWEHGHSLYNELIKIPLIVKFPGNRRAGTQVDHVTSIVDVLPTILELANIKYKNNSKDPIPGLSLVGTETMNPPGQDRQVISYLAPYACSRTPMKVAIISKKYKFIYNEKFTREDFDYFLSPPPQTFKFELYNLVEDKLERINIKESNPAVFSRMVKDLNKVMKEISNKGNNTSFPQKLKKELKQLGYIE